MVAREEQRQPGDMVLVRVGQDDRIDAAIPGRDPLVEHDQQAIRVGSTIDQQAATAGALDQDGVALTDIEDRDTRDPGRPCGDDPSGDDDRDDEGDDRRPSRRATGLRGGRSGTRAGGSLCPSRRARA